MCCLNADGREVVQSVGAEWRRELCWGRRNDDEIERATRRAAGCEAILDIYEITWMFRRSDGRDVDGGLP